MKGMTNRHPATPLRELCSNNQRVVTPTRTKPRIHKKAAIKTSFLLLPAPQGQPAFTMHDIAKPVFLAMLDLPPVSIP